MAVHMATALLTVQYCVTGSSAPKASEPSHDGAHTLSPQIQMQEYLLCSFLKLSTPLQTFNFNPIFYFANTQRDNLPPRGEHRLTTAPELTPQELDTEVKARARLASSDHWHQVQTTGILSATGAWGQ